MSESPVRLRSVVTVGALALSLGLAACGSSSNSNSNASSTASAGSTATATASASSSSSSTTAAKTAPAKAYSGPDAKHFATLSAPTKKSGAKFTVGYLDPAGFIPALVAQSDAAGDEVKALGGSFINDDSNDSVQTQVSQFNNLLAQHVTAILVFPLDPTALGPSLAKAKAAGVTVVTNDTPVDVSQPPIPGYATNVSQAFDYSAFETMESVAKQMPGTTFAVMGTSSPIPSIKYQTDRTIKWGKTAGLTYAGEVDAQTDSPAGWNTAASTILTKYPSTKVIITYNDPSALAASTTARSSGHSDVKVATANGFSGDAKDAMKAGRMVADYAVPWTTMGKQMAIAAYDQVNKLNLPLPKVLGLKGPVATPANVNSIASIG